MKTQQQLQKASIKVLEIKFGREEKEAETDGGGVNPSSGGGAERRNESSEEKRPLKRRTDEGGRDVQVAL